MATYQLKKFKTILNKLKYIDSWFWCRYTLNPYSGCEHNCCYCDARSRKYYLHEDFESVIYVKQDADKILDSRLTRARVLLSDVVSIGGTCDAYQPAEKRFRNDFATRERSSTSCSSIIIPFAFQQNPR
ncbi:MAG: hypothetical protein ACTSWN_02680 [Promethearchaeota archaeon]